jgi:hypothetical protein
VAAQRREAAKAKAGAKPGDKGAGK